MCQMIFSLRNYYLLANPTAIARSNEEKPEATLDEVNERWVSST